jgi:hypothetical protein
MDPPGSPTIWALVVSITLTSRVSPQFGENGLLIRAAARVHLRAIRVLTMVQHSAISQLEAPHRNYRKWRFRNALVLSLASAAAAAL